MKILEFSLKRKRCKTCKKVYKQKKPDSVYEHRNTTKRAVVDIAKSGLTQSFYEISKKYLMTKQTIENIFCDFYKYGTFNSRYATPEYIGLFEFDIERTKDIENTSILVVDLKNKTLFDIIFNPDKEKITVFFSNIPDKERITWVFTDMNEIYKDSIETVLPNARWAIYKPFVKEELINIHDSTEELYNNIRHNIILNKYKNTAGYKFVAFYDNFIKNGSKKTILSSFTEWKNKITQYDKESKELAAKITEFYDPFCALFDAPINQELILQEKNIESFCGCECSLEVMRARILYCNCNIDKLIKDDHIYGPKINKKITCPFLSNCAKRRKQSNTGDYNSIIDKTNTDDYNSIKAKYSSDIFYELSGISYTKEKRKKKNKK